MLGMRVHKRVLRSMLVVLLLVALTATMARWLGFRERADQLLREDPDRILIDGRLMQFAAQLAQPRYQQHCAGCHGDAFQGDPTRGVPNIASNGWLYGNAPVDIEHTILYGIRSGHPKARNVTDMPALVRTGQITSADAWDVVEYLQSLAGRSHNAEAALRGRAVYEGKGNCFDCHAGDARGVTDYGTPALTGPVYLYGGDRQTLYQSILNGRHGQCPAWINVLSPLQIRALTLYLVSGPRAHGTD
jgi:cytochrome c oxidase cbb3-type subunit III